MKRNVVLIDGTWNNEGIGFDTNVAKLDPAYGDVPLIKASANDGIRQVCFYHDGVGSDGPWLRKLLGGAMGCIRDGCCWSDCVTHHISAGAPSRDTGFIYPPNHILKRAFQNTVKLKTLPRRYSESGVAQFPGYAIVREVLFSGQCSSGQL